MIRTDLFTPIAKNIDKVVLDNITYVGGTTNINYTYSSKDNYARSELMLQANASTSITVNKVSIKTFNFNSHSTHFFELTAPTVSFNYLSVSDVTAL